MATNLSAFLKKNKKQRENTTYIASADFTDEHGKPIPWELRPLTTAENDRIREDCTSEVKDKKGKVSLKMDNNAYMARIACAAVVYPNLYDAELQDSYGVKTPEALLKEMLDTPGDYANLCAKVAELSGFDRDEAAEVEEAKN